MGILAILIVVFGAYSLIHSMIEDSAKKAAYQAAQDAIEEFQDDYR